MKFLRTESLAFARMGLIKYEQPNLHLPLLDQCFARQVKKTTEDCKLRRQLFTAIDSFIFLLHFLCICAFCISEFNLYK